MNVHITDPAAKFQQVLAEIQAMAAESAPCTSPKQLHDFEQRCVDLASTLAGAMVGMILQQSIDDEQTKRRAAERIQASPRKLRNQGRRPFIIRMRNGVSVQVMADYYSRSSSLRTNPKHGIYPALAVLGIVCHCTPHAVQQISKLVALASSMQEAEQLLRDHGYRFSVNAIRRIVYLLSALVRAAQSQGKGKLSGSVAGKNVVVSIDGGRLRIRVDKRTRTKKKRKRYSTNWREPKLLIIYVADEKGRIDRTFPPVIDGTLHGPDKAFELLHFYLKQLDVAKANRVLFVADGATWIWSRAAKLLKSLNIAADRCHFLVDFYHAFEYLGKIAESKRQWDKRQRQCWLRLQRRRLNRGDVGTIFEAIKETIGPRPTKDQKKWMNYFKRNALTNRRMDYAAARAHGLPIGSGAMESAIRRIINLRLKGPSIFWHEENAQAILLQRAWHKTGRAQDLMQHAFEGAFAMAI